MNVRSYKFLCNCKTMSISILNIKAINDLLTVNLMNFKLK